MLLVAPEGADTVSSQGVKGLGAGQGREGARGPNPPQTSLEENTDGRLQPFRDPH